MDYSNLSPVMSSNGDRSGEFDRKFWSIPLLRQFGFIPLLNGFIIGISHIKNTVHH